MFYIVQMADFHFGGACHAAGSEKEILKRMAKRIQSEIPDGSEVVFCACGDYIDSKQISYGVSTRALTEDEITARYQDAMEAIGAEIIHPLQKTYDLKIGLCVGNHDTTHMDAMNRFSQAMIGKDIDKTYSIHLDSENVDLIFINSCPPADYSHGEIDYDYLEKILRALSPDSTKYFILHHTLMSMDEHDQSCVRQVPRLIKLIDEYSIRAVFHGHTHGQYLVRVGTVGCPIIGVGAVYVRDFPNVNSQFNLICCNAGLPVSAFNFQYHADWATISGNDGFDKIPIHISETGNFFYGKTFSKIYDELVKKIQAESKLYHVHLHIKSSYDDFCTDVENNFGNQEELETLDRAYSYSELAEMWEAPRVDKNVLYFNHGMYFSRPPYQSGIDYLIHEIGDKRTTSRAVLVTVNTKDISETAPDALLPSLLSIQAGFDQGQTTLHVTMTLRALEASRFLKINICEVLLIVKQLHSKYPFSNVEVVISAFRVQIKEQFGCFLKAKLDTEAEQEGIVTNLSSLLYSNDPKVISNEIGEIIRLIQDKRLRSETVIETNGIEKLRTAITTVKNKLSDDKKEIKANLSKALVCITALLHLLDKLKQSRANSSEQTEDMDKLEGLIQSQYVSLIDEFEKLRQNVFKRIDGYPAV